MVQIPLWTIVTEQKNSAFQRLTRSDSSMDDCNPKSGAAYSPKLTGSDSSMDDCNRVFEAVYGEGDEFRFLYGRL